MSNITPEYSLYDVLRVLSSAIIYGTDSLDTESYTMLEDFANDFGTLEEDDYD